MREIITGLTPQQQALISIYREKWLNAICLTRPIDRAEATAAIQLVYQALDLPQPKILFFDSPLGIVKEILENSYPNNRSFERAYNKFSRQIVNHLDLGIYDQVEEEVYYYIYEREINRLAFKMYGWETWRVPDLWRKIWEGICEVLIDHQDKLYSTFRFLENCIDTIMIRDYKLCKIDFFISALNCHYDREKWHALTSLVRSCGFVLLGEQVCFVSDRPRKLSLDGSCHLHAEGEPAIKFADGFRAYLYHGIRLPKKYGKVCPKEWRSQWLLSEEDDELRRILIQEIGYEKICKELQTIQLDCWGECTLLKIDSDIDVIPVHLLGISDPTTKKIRFCRVPPDLQTAKQAVEWIN
ncbi:DUF6745 domain-containing protein [Lusitaniella coriacea]|uniref:DUF6745 domain-containing protein n=1 Tax=Lusitaniella coriacea TaxID=1983105 RepID=UPI003CF5440C